MEIPSLQSLTQRLDRLERENRLWKFVTGAAMLAMALMLVLGTNLVRPSRVLTAEKFVLQDAHGTPRATLGLEQNGTSGLKLLAPDGTNQAVLQTTTRGGSSLEFFDQSNLKLELTSRRGQGASLSMLDHYRRSSSNLYLLSDGTAGLGLNRDRRGMVAQLFPDGATKLGFFDRKGVEQASLGIASDGSLAPTGSPPSAVSDHMSQIPAGAPWTPLMRKLRSHGSFPVYPSPM